MIWMSALLLFSGSGNAKEMGRNDTAQVPISGTFYGARFRTHLTIDQAPTRADLNPYQLLHRNAEQMTNIRSWVEDSAERFDFDDYGKLQLVVSSIDAMGLTLVDRPRAKTVSLKYAIQRGSWTHDDRLLAIGGGLVALGYNVAVFDNGAHELMLGLGTRDPDLNVESIRQDWTLRRGASTQNVFIEWVLWDGESRIGSLKRFGGTFSLNDVTQIEAKPPKQTYFSFMKRNLPSFALRKKTRVRLPVADSPHTLQMTHHPELARWFELYPEFQFERQVQFIHQERSLLRMGPSIRRIAAQADSEEHAINMLLRALQTEFTYKKGPLRSLSEVIATRHADCDQLALLMTVALKEMGYSNRDVVSIRWPGHLALGIRPKHDGPNGTSVKLDSGQFFILDLTHYLYRHGRLVSRWGSVADEYGSSVSVGSLNAMKRPQTSRR